MQKSLDDKDVPVPYGGFRKPQTQISAPSLSSFNKHQTVTFHEKPEGSTLATWFKPSATIDEDVGTLVGGFSVLDCEDISSTCNNGEIEIRGDRCKLLLRNTKAEADVTLSVRRR